MGVVNNVMRHNVPHLVGGGVGVYLLRYGTGAAKVGSQGRCKRMDYKCAC